MLTTCFVFARLRFFVGLVIVVALLLGIHSEAYSAGWLDNFNDGSITDGNPVMWLTDLGGSGFFPGAYDASSGDLVLDPDDASPTRQMSALVPAFSFTDTYMRTQGKVLPDPNNPANDGGNLVLTARVDPMNLTGYLVYFDVSGNLNLQILAGGTTQDIGTTFDAPFNAGSEVVLELDIIGSELSAYAWLADDPNGKPATPQVTATDASFTSGIAGAAYAEDDPFTSAVYRYVAAQDTPFIDGTPGDYNGNGTVDGADYVVWRNGGPLQHEVATLGSVTPEDYDAWRSRFGNTAGSGLGGGAAVPEPAALLLTMAGVIFGCVSASRRR
jgi:hypothetical protein